MKSIKEFVMSDMWGHILMSGPDVRGYIEGTMYKTAEEQHKYCQGIMTVYPHMMLANFTNWLWPEGAPKPYQSFMEPSVEALQAKVFPVLEQAFAPGLSQEQRGDLLIPLFTDVIPKHVLTGFYDYMFMGQPDCKDIATFWPTVAPVLNLTARILKAAYGPDMPTEEKAEAFLFLGTRFSYLLLKRWYDWQFGAEKMEMPPPPPQG